MGRKRKQLSQAEVWDDTALLQSWDDALAEYKLYHSIHARGERVEDVIKEAEVEMQDAHMTEDDLRKAATDMQTNGIPSEELEDGELEEDKSAQTYSNGESTENFHGPSTIESEQKERLANVSTAVDQQEKPRMPNAVTNGVKDEALKNLMMSWYYAGYYTGLCEGQQQVQNTPSK
ncbi:hypothetical protein HO173_003809 [Letharia columbiana]|uniref:Survival Motor Neuron Gemin2-binding domain-containing protein n=1 Tax=Letharia columbiana TaxID=112416 RepID=A0A8H6G0M3_9LECA|nr:uncharacterized protein HO173_003809 [Letharia columbiana]KAF6238175.1 hypothetical protein HO173_003809 [Letharia columbiana]